MLGAGGIGRDVTTPPALRTWSAVSPSLGSQSGGINPFAPQLQRQNPLLAPIWTEAARGDGCLMGEKGQMMNLPFM